MGSEAGKLFVICVSCLSLFYPKAINNSNFELLGDSASSQLFDVLQLEAEAYLGDLASSTSQDKFNLMPATFDSLGMFLERPNN